MLLQEFNFQLPQELIAQEPIFPRHSSKMLVLDQHESLIDCLTSQLDQFIEPNSLIVCNNSKVIPAKFKVGHIELNLHQNLGNRTWKAFAKGARKINIGDQLKIAEDCYIKVLNKEGGEITIQFHYNSGSDLDAIHRYGQIPLPQYIKRKDKLDSDAKNYQTIYAKEDGSVAAPTAGLHFTEELLQKLKAKNIDYCFVTLHVGAGTFLPVKVENIEDHQMHYETGFINKETKELINVSKKNGKKIIAVGTTSLRLLEASSNEDGFIEHEQVNTNLFIQPGYKFKIVDRLLTNFHLPCSSLFILVCSFAGIKPMKQLYQHAIAKQYRFYSYGDCCLISKKDDYD